MPIEKKLSKKISFNNLLDHIDIGGSALTRAAAKNYNDVTVISDIEDYYKLAKELNTNKGSTSIKFRKFMEAPCLIFLGDYFLSKGEEIKAIEFYQQVFSIKKRNGFCLISC